MKSQASRYTWLAMSPPILTVKLGPSMAAIQQFDNQNILSEPLVLLTRSSALLFAFLNY